MHCTLNCTQCTQCSATALCNVQCALCTVSCALFTVHCALNSVQCYYTQCTALMLRCFSLSGWSRALLYGFWCIHKISPRTKIPPYNANITEFCQISEIPFITPFPHNVENVILYRLSDQVCMQEGHIVSEDLVLKTT